MLRWTSSIAIIAFSVVAGSAWAEGDPAKGERLFNRCKACHTLEEGGADRQGPNLHDLFGRNAGTREGYNYSKAMAATDITWNEETLDGYLADPRSYIPKNKMIFVGIKNDGQRADLIAYLKQATQ